MSDLLPLVVATLRDRVAVDAAEEIANLKRQLAVSRSVEILRAAGDGEEDDEAVVYASAQFLDGQYSFNPNLWQVDFVQRLDDDDETTTTCRLADLRGCRICVGGGITLDSLDDELANRATYDGFFDPDDDADGDNSKAVKFCFCPNTLWLTIVVHGWPREEWEAVIAADNVNPDDVMSFLVETVASDHPEATVEFKDICFTVRTVHGALKRLLPQQRREEVRAERDGRDHEANRAQSELMHFIATAMRNQGNQNGSALFIPQLNEVMRILAELGISELDNNEAVITTIVVGYEQLGRDGMDEVIRRMQDGHMAEDGDEEDMDEDGEEATAGDE